MKVSLKLPSRLPADNRWAAVIPVSLGLAIGSLLFFALLSQEVMKRGTDQFDGAIRLAIHQHASAWLSFLMLRITHLGDWPVIMGGTILALLICAYRSERGFVLLVLVTMAGAGILDGSLKLAFHRMRPDPFIGARPSTYSFPSGHALVSFCFYGLIAGILSMEADKKWQRILIWASAALLVAVIGFSRIYLGVHWPSDVIAGYAAALIWMGAVRVMARVFGHPNR